MSTEEYISDVTTATRAIEPEDIKRFAQEIIGCKGMVYIVGNGGSNSTASHFAEDLIKAAGIRAIAIDSSPLITASVNDNGDDQAFSTGLLVLLREGDLIFGISGSGNSLNIIESWIHSCPPVKMLAILGREGGYIGKELGERDILIVQSNDMQIIEDCHLIITHMICRQIMEMKNET